MHAFLASAIQNSLFAHTNGFHPPPVANAHCVRTCSHRRLNQEAALVCSFALEHIVHGRLSAAMTATATRVISGVYRRHDSRGRVCHRRWCRRPRSDVHDKCVCARRMSAARPNPTGASGTQHPFVLIARKLNTEEILGKHIVRF